MGSPYLISSHVTSKAKSHVYAAALPLMDSENEDGLVHFGGKPNGATYSDGSQVESHFAISRYLWTISGKPEKIVVAFSTDDFFLRDKS